MTIGGSPVGNVANLLRQDVADNKLITAAASPLVRHLAKMERKHGFDDLVVRDLLGVLSTALETTAESLGDRFHRDTPMLLVRAALDEFKPPLGI